MKANTNSIKAIRETQAIVGDMQTYFVPGIGEVKARDMADLEKKVADIKRKAEKVEEDDVNQ